MKFKNRFRDDDEAVPSGPMADITFLLIIFFMVTTTFDVTRGIQMRLPATTTQQDIKERNVTVMIDKAEALYLDTERIELAGLGKTVLAKLAAKPEGFVLIKCDQGVPYRRVVDVLDELLQVGISNIALPTDKEAK